MDQTPAHEMPDEINSEEIMDWLLVTVMDAIKAKNPMLTGWCDRRISYLKKRDRVSIFLWLSGNLDDDNLRIFAEAVGLTLREIQIGRKVAINLL